MKRYEDHYECKECETEVHPVSYRARCPDCGGELHATTRMNYDGPAGS